MKGFELARQQARALRFIIGIEPEGLLQRLEKHLKDNYGVMSLWPVSLDAIDHGGAEVVPAERTIVRCDYSAEQCERNISSGGGTDQPSQGQNARRG